MSPHFPQKVVWEVWEMVWDYQNEGDFYEVCFYTSTGLYQAKLEITDRYKENNIFILVGAFCSDLEKCQRRQYYRLEKIIDIDYRNYTREEEILEKIKRS